MGDLSLDEAKAKLQEAQDKIAALEGRADTMLAKLAASRWSWALILVYSAALLLLGGLLF